MESEFGDQGNPQRDSAFNGRALEFRFCPTCGSTVYWIPEFRPNLVAIALGCFEDPDAMEPTQSVYEATRHAWVSLSFRDSG